MALVIDLGQIKQIEGTSKTETTLAVKDATEAAIRDYLADNSIEGEVGEVVVDASSPSQDGGATIVTILVTAALTAAAQELGKTAVKEITSLIKQYLNDDYRDKVQLVNEDRNST